MIPCLFFGGIFCVFFVEGWSASVRPPVTTAFPHLLAWMSLLKTTYTVPGELRPPEEKKAEREVKRAPGWMIEKEHFFFLWTRGKPIRPPHVLEDPRTRRGEGLLFPPWLLLFPGLGAGVFSLRGFRKGAKRCSEI